MRETSTFRPGNFVFFDRLRSSETNSGIADNIKTAAYNKSMSRCLGPFCIILVSSHSLVVYKHGVHNKNSTHRTSLELHMANSNIGTVDKNPGVESSMESRLPTKETSRQRQPSNKKSRIERIPVKTKEKN